MAIIEKSTEQHEKEANLFARCLLMPRNLMKQELSKIEKKLDYDEAVKIMAAKFQVEEKLMSFRMIELGLVDYGL